MDTSFDIKVHRFDCAQKYLRDIRAQFHGWPLTQIEDKLVREGNWGELDALHQSVAIVKETENEVISDTQFESPLKMQQTEQALAEAIPTPPAQTQQQKLKSGTSLSSIVSPGYERKYKGINWPHFENMLKLYALGYIYRDALTAQQQQDKEDLSRAIEEVGNAKYKKKHLSAEEIMQKSAKAYLRFGQNVICALAHPNKSIAAALQYDLAIERQTTLNGQNQQQLDKIERKAIDIVHLMRNRYSDK